MPIVSFGHPGPANDEVSFSILVLFKSTLENDTQGTLTSMFQFVLTSQCSWLGNNGDEVIRPRATASDRLHSAQMVGDKVVRKI